MGRGRILGGRLAQGRERRNEERKVIRGKGRVCRRRVQLEGGWGLRRWGLRIGAGVGEEMEQDDESERVNCERRAVIGKKEDCYIHR